jgi:hypothetical protein
MPDPNFTTYQKFNDQVLAMELGAFFDEHGIAYELDKKNPFDVTFSNSALNKEFRIKLHPQDFEKADKLLQQVYAKDIDNLEADYYLFSFTDEELEEIIRKRDEWSAFDFVLAQKLLKERGKEVNVEEITQARTERIQELSKPEKSTNVIIALGYALAIAGALGGFLIAYHLITYKRSLPNGDMVTAFSDADRKHGERIMVLAILSVAVFITVKLVL